MEMLATQTVMAAQSYNDQADVRRKQLEILEGNWSMDEEDTDERSTEP